MDVKLQQMRESELKLTPELAPILAEKKMTDARRLKQIRAELVRALDAEGLAPSALPATV